MHRLAHQFVRDLNRQIDKPVDELPGVIGARVKIAKLEIFDDCEVAIRMEGGEW